MLIKSFTNKISTLNKTVGEISGITNFINDIAEQTNLLALNAAIESANNITELIDHVSNGAGEIAKDSEKVNDRLNDSMVIINQSLNAFNEIIDVIADVTVKIGNLSSSSTEVNKEKDVIQSKVKRLSSIADEIVLSSEEVLTSISDISDSTKEVEKTAINLLEVTTGLKEETQVFRTK